MNYEKQFLSKIEKFSNQKRSSPWVPEDYIGGGTSKLVYRNLTMPQVRSIVGEFGFEAEPFEKQLAVMEKIWFKSKVWEMKMISLCWLEKQITAELNQHALRLPKWATEVDNWAHSDSYCGTLARLFENSPKTWLPAFKIWNKSSDPWLRRISLVSLLYYSRFRLRYPSFRTLLSFIKPHLTAPEYYVQKAVGWTLRETYNVYPIETLDFISNNVVQIHPDAWYAASEKIPEKVKLKLIQQRRKFRKNGAV